MIFAEGKLEGYKDGIGEIDETAPQWPQDLRDNQFTQSICLPKGDPFN
jgi:hypothetical protein